MIADVLGFNSLMIFPHNSDLMEILFSTNPYSHQVIIQSFAHAKAAAAWWHIQIVLVNWWNSSWIITIQNFHQIRIANIILLLNGPLVHYIHIILQPLTILCSGEAHWLCCRSSHKKVITLLLYNPRMITDGWLWVRPSTQISMGPSILSSIQWGFMALFSELLKCWPCSIDLPGLRAFYFNF